jgi:hypothetical protein
VYQTLCRFEREGTDMGFEFLGCTSGGWEAVLNDLLSLHEESNDVIATS